MVLEAPLCCHERGDFLGKMEFMQLFLVARIVVPQGGNAHPMRSHVQ